jgi:hypothetical protein
MMLAMLDDGPLLIRYWEPADGSALPTDLGEAVRTFLRAKPHLKVIVNTQTHEDEYRVVAIDTTGRGKIRDWRIGLRETRL